MKVGDLVRHRTTPRQWRLSNRVRHVKDIGIVLEVTHPNVEIPDYRTPTSVLVFYSRPHEYGREMKHEIWFHKNELELIHESR